MPFIWWKFSNLQHDQVSRLRFPAIFLVSKVFAWKHFGWAVDDDVAVIAMGDSPLVKLLVSERVNQRHVIPYLLVGVWEERKRGNGHPLLVLKAS